MYCRTNCLIYFFIASDEGRRQLKRDIATRKKLEGILHVRRRGLKWPYSSIKWLSWLLNEAKIGTFHTLQTFKFPLMTSFCEVHSVCKQTSKSRIFCVNASNTDSKTFFVAKASESLPDSWVLPFINHQTNVCSYIPSSESTGTKLLPFLLLPWHVLAFPSSRKNAPNHRDAPPPPDSCH